ncbi:hypothetical protein VTI28DRAFT_7179 [Corynascus sepedonium]
MKLHFSRIDTPVPQTVPTIFHAREGGFGRSSRGRERCVFERPLSRESSRASQDKAMAPDECSSMINKLPNPRFPTILHAGISRFSGQSRDSCVAVSPEAKQFMAQLRICKSSSPCSNCIFLLATMFALPALPCHWR